MNETFTSFPKNQDKRHDDSADSVPSLSGEGIVSSAKSDAPTDPDRRLFLQKLGAGALVAALPAMPSAMIEGRKLYGETLGREAVGKELEDLREKLRSMRGVEVDFSPLFPNEAEYGLQGEPLDALIEKRDVCVALDQAFDLYPATLLKQLPLSIIRVMDNMKLSEGKDPVLDISGMAAGDRNDGIMHIEYSETQPLDVPAVDMWVNEHILPDPPEMKQASVRRTFDHEIVHFMDDVAKFQWYEETSGIIPGVKFSKSQLPYLYKNDIDYFLQKKAITPEYSEHLKSQYSGFARMYGKTNDWEDRATIGEALFDDQEHLQERMKKDEVLRKKVDNMKRLYFKKSCGTMNQAYWDLIRSSKGDHETMAKYLELRTRINEEMSIEGFMVYVEKESGIKLTSDEAAQWKAALSV